MSRLYRFLLVIAFLMIKLGYAKSFELNFHTLQILKNDAAAIVAGVMHLDFLSRSNDERE